MSALLTRPECPDAATKCSREHTTANTSILPRGLRAHPTMKDRGGPTGPNGCRPDQANPLPPHPWVRRQEVSRRSVRLQALTCCRSNQGYPKDVEEVMNEAIDPVVSGH